MRNGRSKLAALAAIPLLATACSSGDNGDSTSGGGDLNASLTGAGASFPDPLFQDWMYTYSNDVQPDVSINYQSVGSGAGVEQFLEQTVDFGSSEEYLDDEELAAAADARDCRAVQFPVVFGAVVIAFDNPELDGLVLDRRPSRESTPGTSPPSTPRPSPNSTPTWSCRATRSSRSTARTVPAPPSCSRTT